MFRADLCLLIFFGRNRSVTKISSSLTLPTGSVSWDPSLICHQNLPSRCLVLLLRVMEKLWAVNQRLGLKNRPAVSVILHFLAAFCFLCHT